MQSQPSFTWESAAESHVGKVRTANEDSILNRLDLGLWAVADGMGGHIAGAEASHLVVKTLEATPPASDLRSFSTRVKEALQQANHSLVKKGLEEGNRISGSTAAVFLSVAKKASVVWVGDSRVYRYRQGKLSQLSRDHSQLEEWIAKGLVDSKDARYHSYSNIITRAIGAEEQLEPEEKLLEVEPEDIYLICSDGLYNEVTDDELSRFLATDHCAIAAKQLLELALERGARDNVSLIIAHARSEDDTEAKTLVNPHLNIR